MVASPVVSVGTPTTPIVVPVAAVPAATSAFAAAAAPAPAPAAAAPPPAPAPSPAAPPVAPAADSGPSVATREAIRAAALGAVDEAVSVARSWQRETQNRLERLETEVGELRAAERARAERERLRPAATVLTGAAESSPSDPGLPAHSAAIARTSREVIEAPAVGRPVQAVSPIAVQEMRPAPAAFARDRAETDMLARIALEPVDTTAFEAAISGHRRKRIVGLVVTIILLVFVGGLAALAIASQSGVKI